MKAESVITKEDAEEYTQSLGQNLSGSYRQILLGKKMGVPVALGLTVEEWVTERLGGYVKLGVEDRRAAGKELIGEGLSQRETAEVLGVSPMTVNRDLVTNVTDDNEDQERDSVPQTVTNVTSEPVYNGVALTDAENLTVLCGDALEVLKEL